MDESRQIVKLLAENPQGLTITQIHTITSINIDFIESVINKIESGVLISGAKINRVEENDFVALYGNKTNIYQYYN